MYASHMKTITTHNSLCVYYTTNVLITLSLAWTDVTRVKCACFVCVPRSELKIPDSPSICYNAGHGEGLPSIAGFGGLSADWKNQLNIA